MSLPLLCTLLLLFQVVGMLIFCNYKWIRFIINTTVPLGIMGAILLTPIMKWSCQSVALSMNIDALSTVFIFILMLSSLLFTLYNPQSRHILLRCSFFTQLMIFFIFCTLTANTTHFFLGAMEGVSISLFFLLLCTQRKAIRLYNVWFYFIITHIAFVMITCAFCCFSAYNGDPHFDAFFTGIKGLDATTSNIIFLLLTFGFCAKAGLFPFHLWMPALFASAPTQVVGLLSSSFLSLGIYGLFRFIEPFLFTADITCGIIITLFALISVIVGILSLTIQVHFRRCIAFSLMINNAIIVFILGLSILCGYYGLTDLLIYAMGGMLAIVFVTSLSMPFQVLSTAYIQRISKSFNINECGAILRRSRLTAILWMLSMSNITLMPFTMGFFALLMLLIPITTLLSSPQIPIPVLIAAVTSAALLPLSTGTHILAYQKMFGIGIIGPKRSAAPDVPQHFSAKFYVLFMLLLLIGFTFLSFPIIQWIFPDVLSNILHLDSKVIYDLCNVQLHRPLRSTYIINLTALGIFVIFIFRYQLLRQKERRFVSIWNQGYKTPNVSMYGTASTFSEEVKEFLVPGGTTPPSPIPQNVEFPDPIDYTNKSDLMIYDWLLTLTPLYIKRWILNFQPERWRTRYLYLFYTIILIAILVGIYLS